MNEYPVKYADFSFKNPEGENELVAERFFHKFHGFTNDRYEVEIKWMTRTVKSLFSLKDKNPIASYMRDFVIVEKIASEKLVNKKE